MTSRGEQVLYWIRSTQNVLNQQLEYFSSIYPEAYLRYCQKHNLEAVKQPIRGWEEIDGQRVFTAIGFCEDVSSAFALALPVRFPSISQLFYNDIYCQLMNYNMHTILRFGFGQRATYFVDGTYGQMAGARNLVVTDRYERIADYYDLVAIPPTVRNYYKMEYPGSRFIRDGQICQNNVYSDYRYPGHPVEVMMNGRENKICFHLARILREI